MEKFIEVDNIGNYSEQIVKRKMPVSTVTTLVVSLIMAVTIMCLSVYLSAFFGWFVPIALLMLGLGIWLIYYMIKNAGIEYEYTFVVGEMRIDRIKGKSRRKRLTTFDVKSIDDLDRYIDPETAKPKVNRSAYKNIFMACVYETNPDTFYMVVHDKKKQQPALLLFTPNDKTLSQIQPYLSVTLKKKFLMLKKQLEQEKKAALKAAEEYAVAHGADITEEAKQAKEKTAPSEQTAAEEKNTSSGKKKKKKS